MGGLWRKSIGAANVRAKVAQQRQQQQQQQQLLAQRRDEHWLLVIRVGKPVCQQQPGCTQCSGCSAQGQSMRAWQLRRLGLAAVASWAASGSTRSASTTYSLPLGHC